MRDELEIKKREETDPLEERIDEMEKLEREDGLGNDSEGVTDEVHEVE
ncbi:MAG: hypothetical protein HDQ88_07550 [Clostridia bacterium]|nr:hypothetical protein [Clostridia bacterium]